MLKKKDLGFTLIELMAVLTILGVIALLVVPSVDKMLKNNKQKLYDIQINNIKAGASNWATDNIKLLPKEEEDRLEITLGDLKQGGFVVSDIKNPKTGELFPNDLIIIILYHNNKYIYTVEDSTYGLIINDIIVNMVTNNSITITVEADNNTSNYYYRLDNGEWAISNSNTHTFTGLLEDTKYTIKVKVSDDKGKTIERSIKVKTLLVDMPTYFVDNTNPTKNNVTVTVTYPVIKQPNWDYAYKKDSGEWIIIEEENKVNVVFSDNGTIVAKIIDNTNDQNTLIASALQINNIDKTPPTNPTEGSIGSVSGNNVIGTINTPATGSTDPNGVKYFYLVTNTSTTPSKTNSGFGTNLTYNRSCNTSYYGWVVVEDNLGNRSNPISLGNTSDGVNQYSEWGECSVSCGGGTKTRTNSCLLVTEDLSSECNTQACCTPPTGTCTTPDEVNCGKTCTYYSRVVTSYTFSCAAIQLCYAGVIGVNQVACIHYSGCDASGNPIGSLRYWPATGAGINSSQHCGVGSCTPATYNNTYTWQ